jgi:hypothetical protein
METVVIIALGIFVLWAIGESEAHQEMETKELIKETIEESKN